IKSPAIMPPNKPIHGLAAPIPSRVSTACVSAAAVNAPASIFPSSAILITPERSEKRPPSAASTSGVASRIVEAMSERVKMSLMCLNAPRQSSSESPLEETFSSYKQDDHTLQYLHDVLGYMFRKTIDVDAAVLQCRKQQRRQNDAHRMIATEQGDCDTGKAVVIGKAIVVTMTIAEHLVDRDHARQSSGHGHRENNLFANRDATILSRERIAAGSADLVTPLCAPEKQIDQQTAKQRENEGHVQRNAFRKTGNEFAEMRDVGARPDHGSLHYRVAGNFVVILREVTDERDRDEVQHNRVDDFVRSELRFQDSGDTAPNRAGQDRSRTAQRNQEPRTQVGQSDSHPRCRKRRDVELTFGADVE